MHPSLRIQNGANGLELVTSTSTRKGEVLVQLPRHLQLTETCDDPPPELTALMGKVPKELWQARLALALLRQVLAHLLSCMALILLFLGSKISSLCGSAAKKKNLFLGTKISRADVAARQRQHELLCTLHSSAADGTPRRAYLFQRRSTRDAAIPPPC